MNSKTIVFDLFDNAHLTSKICKELNYTLGKFTVHQFPDEEIMIRIETPVENNTIVFIASIDKPNPKLAKLFFTADTTRELGAKSIGLISPYLAYMRQDKQFNPGEGITSKYFAKMISAHFDWCLTVDPHLHRWHSLNEIFTIPIILLHASSSIAQWIAKNIPNPVLIGPDIESQQWVAEIAKAVNSPFVVVTKQRFGDTSVKSTLPLIESYKDRTPVIVDDIISTAETMIETINNFKTLGMKNIHCIGVHALFADSAYQNLLSTQVVDVATCNTVPHQSNKIDLSDRFVDALRLYELKHTT